MQKLLIFRQPSLQLCLGNQMNQYSPLKDLHGREVE
uniref:Uncharacterized protein n=1 Tax=Arundo donax TaxID=35708 RepID=A0A0A9EWU8_ARUDO